MINSRTIRSYNLHLLDPLDTVGKFNLPFLKKENGVPKRLIGFNQILSFRGNKSETGVHFYLDDYQFERVWNRPERYVSIFQKFQMIIMPDFSTFLDMPMAMILWNCYRNRLLGAFYQRNGIRVIPSLCFGREEMWSFCMDGIPRYGTISVGTLGKKANLDLWKYCMDESLSILQPKKIIMVGERIQFDAGNAKVVWFQPEHLARMRKIRKKGNGPRTNFLVQNSRLVYYVANMMGSQEGPDGGRTASQNSTNRRVFFTTSAVCPSWKSGLHLQDALLTPDSLGTAPMSFP